MYRLDRFNRHKDYLKYTMPYGRIIRDPAIILNKDGSIQTTFKYRGPDLDSAVREQLAILTQQLNLVLTNMDTGWVLYFEAQRSASTEYDRDVYFPDPITKAMDEERRIFFQKGTHFESNYYCTVCWMPPSDNEGKLRNFVVEGKKKKSATIDDYLEVFASVVDKLYGVFQSQRIPCHYMTPDEMLTYLHSCVSTDNRAIKMPLHPMLIDNLIYDSPLYGGLEPRLGKMHLRVVSPIGYLDNSYFGMFDALNRLNFPYRWVTRYYCLSKQDAADTVGEIQKKWYGKTKSMFSMFKELVTDRESDANLNINAVRKMNEAKDAVTAIESDITTYGYYTTCIVVMDEDQDTADSKADQVNQVFTNLGFKSKTEELQSVEAWMGSIPGNYGHGIRRPIVSAGNLVHMMPLSDIWAGEPRNKHLNGPSLIYTQTSGNTPFRLNLHVGDVGHTLIVGPTGAGKSVQLNIIAASYRKYKNARVCIFDKGASSLCLTAGVGGTFYDLGNESEGSLSFQPLAQIDDQNERQWVLEWLIDYIRHENLEITPERKNMLWDALNNMRSLPIDKRRMTVLVNYVQSLELKTALRPLTTGNAYGAMFDSDHDGLAISSWQTFEMSKLMSKKEIVGTTLMYIFHRIEQELKGEPTVIILDECWVFFDNEQFAQKIRMWLKELRKYNTSVIFATQSLSDIVNSPIFSTVLEACASQIFLPNDKALEESIKAQYVRFGLNQKQIEIIASAIKKKQYYYVSPNGSRLYDLALEYCPVSLAYVAVNKADTNKAMEILQKYGPEHFNEHWLQYRNLTLPEVRHSTLR